MSVKIIRAHENPKFSLEIRKVRIDFIDGTFMTGKINIHSKHKEDNSSAYDNYNPVSDSKFKFKRTSDYLRECSQSDRMLTVFDATYNGKHNLTCFVFLHNVKFISEEDED